MRRKKSHLVSPKWPRDSVESAFIRRLRGYSAKRRILAPTWRQTVRQGFWLVIIVASLGLIGLQAYSVAPAMLSHRMAVRLFGEEAVHGWDLYSSWGCRRVAIAYRLGELFGLNPTYYEDQTMVQACRRQAT